MQMVMEIEGEYIATAAMTQCDSEEVKMSDERAERRIEECLHNVLDEHGDDEEAMQKGVERGRVRG